MFQDFHLPFLLAVTHGVEKRIAALIVLREFGVGVSGGFESPALSTTATKVLHGTNFKIVDAVWCQSGMRCSNENQTRFTSHGGN